MLKPFPSSTKAFNSAITVRTSDKKLIRKDIDPKQ